MPDNPHTDMRISACERDLRRQRALLDWLSQRTLSDYRALADRVNALETASRPPAHPSVSPGPRSPASGPEKPLADEVLADLRDLLAEFAAEIERLEGVVEQQRLAIINRDNEIRAYKERESRDLEDARKWRELVERVRDDE